MSKAQDEKLKAGIARHREEIKKKQAKRAELRTAKAAGKPAPKAKRAPAKRRSPSRSTQAQASA